MAGRKTEVGIVVNGKNLSGPALDQAITSMEKLAAKGAKMGRELRMAGMMITAVGFAGVMMSKKLLEGFKATETAMANVNTMLSLGEDAYKDYNSAVDKLITTLPVAGGKIEALNGLYMVLSAGIKHGADSVMVLEEAMKAAKAGMSDTATAVDVITGVLNAYQMQAQEASHVSDLLFMTVKMGKTTFGALANAVGPIIAIAAQVGVGFEQVAAAMATLTKGSVQTDLAATALKATMTAFLKPSEDMVKLVIQNASAWGVMTPQLLKATTMLGDAQAGMSAAKAEVDRLKMALEAAAPVPDRLTEAFSKAEEALMSSKDEFDRHSVALRSMQSGYDEAAGAIKGLSDEMAGISLEEKKNRLEIMKIRQKADDEGREMTSSELARIKSLEEANDRLAIKSTELSLTQDEMRIAQSKRTTVMDAEKAKMAEVSAAMDAQKETMAGAQTAVDEWSENYKAGVQVQLEAAEKQKTAAEDSVDVWTDKLGEAGASAVSMMLETQGLLGAITLLSAAVDGDKAAIAELFPNIRALTAVLPLTGEMAEVAAQDLIDMGDASGEAGAAFDKQANTTASQLEKLSGQLEIYKEKMAEDATPAMIKMKETQVKLIGAFVKANEATGGALMVIRTYGSAVLAAIGPMISMIGQIMIMKAARLQAAAARTIEAAAEAADTTAKAANTAATTTNTASIWANTAALLANPMVWIVVLIMILIGALVWLAKNWDKVTDAMGRFGGWVKDKFGKMVGWFKSGFEKIGGFFSNVGGKIKEFGGKFVDLAKKVAETHAKMRSTVKEGLLTLMGNFQNFFVNLKGKMYEWGQSAAKRFADGLKNKVGAIKEALKKIADKVKNFLGFSTPPAEGPLHEADQWGPHFIDAYSTGMLGRLPDLERRMREVSEAVKIRPMAPTPMAAGPSTTFARTDARSTKMEVHQHFTNVDMETVAEQVLKLLADRMGV